MDAVTNHIWVGFAGGLAAFAHCAAMCGGFALHLSREGNRHRMLAGQLLWHIGKLCSYLFLGAVAGFTGGYFQLFFLRHGLWQNLLSYAAGAVMLLMGLSLLGLLPVRAKQQNLLGDHLAAVFGRLFSPSSPGAALAMGLATGFLPCPIILAFIAYSLQTGSVISGMATMASLSLGTALPLLVLSGAARLTGWHLRRWAPRMGGAILVLLALSTTLRGTSIYHKLLGCPPKPVLHQSDPHESNPHHARTSYGNSSDN